MHVVDCSLKKLWNEKARPGYAADRVQGGYPRVSNLRVSGSVSDFHLQICRFGYPKNFEFGVDP